MVSHAPKQWLVKAKLCLCLLVPETVGHVRFSVPWDGGGWNRSGGSKFQFKMVDHICYLLILQISATSHACAPVDPSYKHMLAQQAIVEYRQPLTKSLEIGLFRPIFSGMHQLLC